MWAPLKYPVEAPLPYSRLASALALDNPHVHPTNQSTTAPDACKTPRLPGHESAHAIQNSQMFAFQIHNHAHWLQGASRSHCHLPEDGLSLPSSSSALGSAPHRLDSNSWVLPGSSSVRNQAWISFRVPFVISPASAHPSPTPAPVTCTANLPLAPPVPHHRNPLVVFS